MTTGASIKPILALLGVILMAYIINVLIIRLLHRAEMTFEFSIYLVGSLAFTLLLESLLVLLVAYLWSQPVDHRIAAWVFLIAGCAMFIYPYLHLTGLFRLISAGGFILIFYPGRVGSLCAAVIAASGLFHLVRYRNEKPPLAER